MPTTPVEAVLFTAGQPAPARSGARSGDARSGRGGMLRSATVLASAAVAAVVAAPEEGESLSPRGRRGAMRTDPSGDVDANALGEVMGKASVDV